MELARRLATRPPRAIGAAKRAVKLGATLSQPEGLLFEMLHFVATGTSDDAKTGARFFGEAFRAGRRSREIFAALRAGEGPTFEGK
jgi:enoyl-CoA hydratase/carnithine racemase